VLKGYLNYTKFNYFSAIPTATETELAEIFPKGRKGRLCKTT